MDNELTSFRYKDDDGEEEAETRMSFSSLRFSSVSTPLISTKPILIVEKPVSYAKEPDPGMAVVKRSSNRYVDFLSSMHPAILADFKDVTIRPSSSSLRTPGTGRPSLIMGLRVTRPSLIIGLRVTRPGGARFKFGDGYARGHRGLYWFREVPYVQFSGQLVLLAPVREYNGGERGEVSKSRVAHGCLV
ncbi:hypothetical protein PR202_ga10441 [Eleusine coracana subsp. coracana]|uniref:Uncharacterized protein n=1 Tax=Eleusine coracana subsp. coracana TaxID=191504 RepID=A0AAV5C6Q9_ELECO|nr:hypothetical protein PR202_ga10441 [Eleusine coracana subsp. coracana]